MSLWRKPTPPASTTIGLLVLAALGGCRTKPGPGPLDPRPVVELESWRAEIDGDAIGRVVLIEIQDREQPTRMYRVESRNGQWLGWVDLTGRVWQRVPFELEDVFRGLYPMEKGLALLYEVDAPVRLVPEGTTAAEATARKRNE